MRRLLLLLVAAGAFGIGTPALTGHASTAPSDGSIAGRLGRVEALMVSMFDDVSAILVSYARGIDGDTSPLNKPRALAEDRAHLDAASTKALQVADELQHLAGLASASSSSPASPSR